MFASSQVSFRTPEHIDPVERPPQGQHLTWLTLWGPRHRVHVCGSKRFSEPENTWTRWSGPHRVNTWLGWPCGARPLPPGPRFISSVNPLEWLPRGQPWAQLTVEPVEHVERPLGHLMQLIQLTRLTKLIQLIRSKTDSETIGDSETTIQKLIPPMQKIYQDSETIPI